MFPSLRIATSGLVAQRIRMNAISGNLANLTTTHNDKGEAEPYKPRFAVFQADDSIGAYGAAGVRVSRVETADVEPLLKYMPGHPAAIKEGPKKGYVAYPQISMITQFTDALEAARAYEANLGSIEIAKDLLNQSLRIVA